MKNQQPKLQQTITPKDLVKCKCGSGEFVSTHRVAVKKSPLIGEKPAIVGIALGFRCAQCNENLNLLEEENESNVNSPT